MTQLRTQPHCLAESIAEHIQQALAGIRYGSVEIVIHDGKVVQIERREKLRFPTTTTGRTSPP